MLLASYGKLKIFKLKKLIMCALVTLTEILGQKAKYLRFLSHPHGPARKALSLRDLTGKRN